MNISDYKGVMVFAEQRGGAIQKIAYELLGVGRGIADTLEEPLIAVLIGSGLEEAQGRDLIAQGADMLGWTLDELLERTLQAMQQSEEALNAEFGQR